MRLPRPTQVPRRFRYPLALAMLAAGVGAVLLLRHRATRSPRPVVVLDGAPGSFGGLAHVRRLPGGVSFRARAVSGWRFLPGQAAYFTTVAPDGTVLIANEPQTDNQLQPTSREMTVSAFSPASNSFRNVVIPTTTGVTRVSGSWPSPTLRVGGADISDIAVTGTSGQRRVVFLSAMPYEGWSLARDGVYPTLGYLTDDGGRWSYDPKASRTALELADSATPASGEPCTPETEPGSGRFADCHLSSQFDTLAGSSDLIVAQYAARDASATGGGLMVLSSSGRVLASYDYPSITLPSGQVVDVHPREVDADPITTGDEKRFVVIFDVTGQSPTQTGTTPFAMQEFGFNRQTRKIEPLSAPALSGKHAPDGRPLGFETAAYDRQGDLWAGQSENGTLTGGPLAVYPRASDGATLGRGACAVSSNWAGGEWGMTCASTKQVPRAAQLGIVRSINQDPRTGAMLVATLPGDLLSVATRHGTPIPTRTRVIELGLDRLADRTTHAIGIRAGAIDARTDTLYLPVQQLQSASGCRSYPCRPTALDQWLLAVNLAPLLSNRGAR